LDDLKADDKLQRAVLKLQHEQRTFRQLTRLTVKLSDMKIAQSVQVQSGPGKVLSTYDIVAVQPVDEKTFQRAVQTLNVDIVTFDISRRMGFHLKRPALNAGVERGIHYELTYGPALQNISARKQVLSAMMDMRTSTRPKNIILCSGAKQSLDIRNTYDAANMAVLCGFKPAAAKATMSVNAESVIICGRKLGFIQCCGGCICIYIYIYIYVCVCISLSLSLSFS
jgi:ribonuclease P/MRP protein subunit RPP1